MQFVFVLAMVFLGGGLMEFVGMEGILGAFLAGLVLNRLIPHVSPLMNRLEFVGNALFIPYFLIGVGMIIDVRSLFTGGEALKVAVVMTVVATFSKWLAAFVTQKVFRMNSNECSMMFGLSNAQAAATLAAVLIGHNIILENGERLLNDDVLNGTVVMILFTCIISSFVTERASRRFALHQELQENTKDKKIRHEHILIPVANPETIENLMNLALVLRDTKKHTKMMALNVINDSNSSASRESSGRHNLEKAAAVASAVDVKIDMVSRYDLNIASGIIHTAKEYDATDIIVGLHHKSNIVDSFFGSLTENLVKGIHREVMIARFLIPVNTLRRIIVAVPPKAEYETGFGKWVEQCCRISTLLGCRIQFFACEATLRQVEAAVIQLSGTTLAEYSLLDSWDDLLLLTGQVNFDHLLIVICARRGSISYDTSFEKLSSQISKYFSNNSLIVLFPEQYGEPQEIVSFSDPRGHNESQHYDKVGNWIYNWFKKKN
jgi:nucleotide-binding universal stress UspA family protein